MNTIARFAKDESGATAIEYGLIAMLISVAIITILRSIGTNLNLVFTNVNSGLAGAQESAYAKTIHAPPSANRSRWRFTICNDVE